jgi:hypothetical protein
MAERHQVSESEQFPVYYLDQGGFEVDLPDGFAERYRQAQDEWSDVQDILDTAYTEADERRKRGTA